MEHYLEFELTATVEVTVLCTAVFSTTGPQKLPGLHKQSSCHRSTRLTKPILFQLKASRRSTGRPRQTCAHLPREGKNIYLDILVIADQTQIYGRRQIQNMHAMVIFYSLTSIEIVNYILCAQWINIYIYMYISFFFLQEAIYKCRFVLHNSGRVHNMFGII